MTLTPCKAQHNPSINNSYKIEVQRTSFQIEVQRTSFQIEVQNNYIFLLFLEVKTLLLFCAQSWEFIIALLNL